MINLIRGLVPQRLINIFWHLPKAILANFYFNFPSKSLKIIGVTGTDGKTTTSSIIYHILKEAGFKAGLISTVSAKIGKEEVSTGLHVTSPDPWKLQKIIKEMAGRGCEYLVLEVTSHGLDQYRLFGINFEIGVITNVTHEHLDYHKDYKGYLKAKCKLFKNAKISILNKDDKSFKYINNAVMGKIISYGKKTGDINLKNFPFETSLAGEYNKYNILASVAVVKRLDIDDQVIRKAVKGFDGVVGRMDEIKTGKDFRVFIDFAHTPNALQNALKTLKSLKPARLIAVFGCAGLRDVRKRPMMGGIACKISDIVILTSEDPRTEDLEKIINEIKKGCEDKKKIVVKKDRQMAIDWAVKRAKKGDIIGIFGKGHEKSMCFGKKEIPWSDHKAVKKALKRLR